MEGTVIRSVAGHDKNRFYVIVSAQAGFVWIADGKERKLEKPKRKNPRHVAFTTTVLDLAVITSNRKLRTLLAPFNAVAGGPTDGMEGT
ncbi:MAG: KOW domain-containing RNA-binding protein [Oscillospiraceae bacterium]|nr:KOW domain-containing RNA-binding protein [Oscillospiraceae bacterium]